MGRTAHLAHAGFPLPAQVSGLLLQPLHFLGMGCGSILQLSPEVPQLRCQSIHGALGKMGSSDGAAPSFPISPHHWLPAGPAELSTLSSKHGPSRWPARPSVIPQCLVSTVHVAGLSRRLGDSQSRAVPPPSDGDSQGRAEAPHTAWSLPPGQSHASPQTRGSSRKGCVPWLRWRPACPVYPTRSCSCRL